VHVSFITNGPSGMVFEHLQDYFDPKDSTNGFIQLHQLCSHVAINCIPGFVVQILGVNKLLVLTKSFGGIPFYCSGRNIISASE